MSDVELVPEEEPQAAIVNLVAPLLREPVAVRAQWRDTVLRQLDALDRPRSRDRVRTRWVLTTAMAVAAGLGCMMIGAAAALLLFGRVQVPWIADAQRAEPPVIALGKPHFAPGPPDVRFALVAPYAADVSVVGDFNRWNPRALPMRRLADGRTWVLDVALPPGRHVYAFVVDGDLMPDPAAPRAADDDFGMPNSVVLVSERRP